MLQQRSGGKEAEKLGQLGVAFLDRESALASGRNLDCGGDSKMDV